MDRKYNVWSIFYDWYKALPIVRKLRERRLISTTIVLSLLMILIAQLSSASHHPHPHHQNPNHPSESAYHTIVINWCCGVLYLSFALLILLLLAASPSNGTFSTLYLLICFSLTLVEMLIAGMTLHDDGAFLVRLVGYILISCLELISSTKFKEWTLFGLFISFGVDFISWIILIPLQQQELRAVTMTASIIHFLISIGLSMAVWIYMIRVPVITGQRVLHRDDVVTGVGSKGFRYDDAIYSLSTAWNEFDSGFEQNESSNRGNPNAGDERSTLASYFGSQSVEEDDVEILNLKLSEPTNPYVPRVMIALHIAVGLITLLVGQGILGSGVGHTILAVVVNSFICLWQVLFL